jgi:hypothetical protein
MPLKKKKKELEFSNRDKCKNPYQLLANKIQLSTVY